MVAEHLTIRNLTTTPIILKLIERFHPHKDPRDDIHSLARNFTRILSNVTRTNETVAAITDDNEPFAHEEYDIHVEPFQTVQTEVRAFIDSDKERLRWTFEAEGERHQIQTPVPTTESAGMKALLQGAKARCGGAMLDSV